MKIGDYRQFIDSDHVIKLTRYKPASETTLPDLGDMWEFEQYVRGFPDNMGMCWSSVLEKNTKEISRREK